jgi:sigma-B regulation protein RsbU (phosphoserine phosphatase)
MRSNRLQFVLLALIASGSLAYYLASASATIKEIYGDRIARAPTTNGYRLNVVSGVAPEAAQAGIRFGDRMLAVNGRRFTGNNVYLEELRKSRAGDLLDLTIGPPNGAATGQPPRVVAVRLQPVYGSRPGLLELFGRVLFLSVIFPFACLALGTWVVAARPRDKNAWFLLGILQYFVVIFGEVQFWPGPLYAFITVWTTLGLFAGPLSIMFFGIYFPERSQSDLSLPWIKWIVTGMLAALVPVALVYNLGFAFSFASIARLAPHVGLLFRALTLLAMIAIGIYFYCLGSKAATAKSPDLRRRLRILYVGSTVGNGPLFFLVLYSLATDHDLGYGVPPWLFLTALFIFTLFPLSLAYVVVVHRAMDLRIMLRQGTKYAFARSSIWFIRSFTALLFALSLIHALRNRPPHWDDVLLVVSLAALLLVVRLRTTKTLSAWIDRKFFREAYSAEQVLSELSTQAQSFGETAPLIRTVSECIAKALHVDKIAVLLRSGDTFRLQYASGVEGGADLLLSGSSKTIANLDLVKTPANVYLDNPDAWLLAATDAERSALRALGAEMLIPLRGRNRLLGVMALGPKRSEEPYSRTDRGLLQSVAMHTGLSIENSELANSLAAEAAQRERINREIEIAREVQDRFLPQSVPRIAGVELAGACRPAQGVGGDYYDFIEMKAFGNGASGGSSLGIAIGDISGKGISAALLMASLRASLRGLTRNSNGDLAGMMSEVNELVYEASTSNRYATFFFAQLDPASRQLTYVNGGHNAPALLRRCHDTGKLDILRLEAGGPVVGLIEKCQYDQTTLALQPGDILLCFTDGISEAMNHEDEEWGEERLIERLSRCPDLSAAELVKCLMESADEFAAGAPQHDDMTLLIMKVLPA